MYDNDYTTDRTSSKFVARIARIACNSMRTLTEDMLHSTRQTLLKKHVHQHVQSMCTLHVHLSSLLVCAACHDVYERTPFLGTIAMHKRCHVLSFFSAVISLCFAMFASFINVVTTSYSTEVTYCIIATIYRLRMDNILIIKQNQVSDFVFHVQWLPGKADKKSSQDHPMLLLILWQLLVTLLSIQYEDFFF